MGIEFLVEMRQSNKYGSVKNDEIINLHLGPCVGPWDSIPCILQDTSHNLPEKAKNPEARFNSKQIISYCLGPHTQNPRLRKVDLVPSPKRWWQDQHAEIRKKNSRRKKVVLYSLDSRMDPSTERDTLGTQCCERSQ